MTLSHLTAGFFSVRLSPKRLNQAGDPARAFLAGHVDFHIPGGFSYSGGISSVRERGVAGVRVCAESYECPRGPEVEAQ